MVRFIRSTDFGRLYHIFWTVNEWVAREKNAKGHDLVNSELIEFGEESEVLHFRQRGIKLQIEGGGWMEKRGQVYIHLVGYYLRKILIGSDPGMNPTRSESKGGRTI